MRNAIFGGCGDRGSADGKAILAQFSLFSTKSSFGADADNSLFAAECSRCHDAARAHRYAKSPAEWRETVSRMLDRAPLEGPRRETKRCASGWRWC